MVDVSSGHLLLLGCQTSKTRMCTRLEIRTGRLAHTRLTGDARLEFPAPEMREH